MAGQSEQWIVTARALRRTGFGTTGTHVDEVVRQGWAAYIDAALAADPNADPGAKATPMPTFETLRRPGKNATAQSRKDFNHQQSEQMSALGRWWLRRMTAVEQPVHEKLTLLWHNHFATSAEKVRSTPFMAGQNQTLRNLSLGDFRTLSYAMLTDAAMLHWLDAQTNTAKAPNENLAREFMELFTLGHGDGYTEDDVRAGARALTGWVVHPNGQTAMVPKRHDHSAKTIFGVTKNYDAAGFRDVVLSQPKSADYVAGRLWQQLASDTPPSPATLSRLTDAYGAGRDLRKLTRAIVTDDEFTRTRAGLVNTPIEWLVGVARSLKLPLDDDADANAAMATLRALGQRPFYPPDVGGWPHGQVWMSTASADVRMRAAHRMARSADLSVIDATKDDRLDAVGYLIGVGAWSDSTAAALAPLTRQPIDLVTAAVNTPEYLTS